MAYAGKLGFVIQKIYTFIQQEHHSSHFGCCEGCHDTEKNVEKYQTLWIS